MRRTAARTVLTLTAALIAGVGAGVGAASSANAAPSAGTTPSGLRDVMWVGNNWAGTASIVDARKLQVLRRGVDLVPDKAQELA
ncbi:MAG: serine/threonine protein kinase, partial [Marmoricola sp.]|nr:serine/threonine protein kinase [Marmoricola sp.]